MIQPVLRIENDQVEQNSDLIKKIIRASIDSVNPYCLVSDSIVLSNANLCIGKKTYSNIKNIILIAIGKASLSMSRAVMDSIGDHISRGICVTKVLQQKLPEWPQIEIIQGGHPIPDNESIHAGNQIRELLKEVNSEDLVIVLISGGASALVASPYSPISLNELQLTNQLLVKSGANINEINSVRKHLEMLKGGGMLSLAGKAKVHALILSDVIGDDLGVIASGPTVADESTYSDAWNIIERYGLVPLLPESVVSRLKAGVGHEISETLKPGNLVNFCSASEVIACNRSAIDAILDEMRESGFDCACISDNLRGEARQTSQWFVKEGLKLIKDMKRPTLVVGGGETTVKVIGTGLGGRNLEFALAAVQPLAQHPGVMLFTLATDGEDGPTDAAGAIVTADTMKRAQNFHLDSLEFLENNDAYHFFEKVGGLIKTGSTGTNVNDLVFMLKV